MAISVSVFIATSLDGFIARSDGSLDWLDDANATVTEGEDCGYTEFMKSVDVLVMGRKTYEKVLSFGAWPYGGTHVVVLSSCPIEFPNHLPDSVAHSSETPSALLQRLESEKVAHVYVDGGVTIQRFLAEGLVDKITVTTIPILLGKGLPLFGALGCDVHLTHIATKTFDFGFVQSTYGVNSLPQPTA